MASVIMVTSPWSSVSGDFAVAGVTWLPNSSWYDSSDLTVAGVSRATSRRLV